MFNNHFAKADAPKRARKSKKNGVHRHSPGAARVAEEEARALELDRLLEERLAQSAMTEEESAYIQEALDSLAVTVRQAGEDWCARPFGSAASALRTRGSDVDVTCLCEGGPPADQSLASLISEKIGPLFQSHPRFKIVEEVLHAKVPILKLRFDDQLEIDLSCQNTRALQNTRLLRAYADLDERVRNFVIAVKLWAKGAGVCGASNGRLSSYAFTLLAIYYLQVDPEVALPCLPADAFREEAYLGQDDERIVSDYRGRWSCPLSAVELLQRFFQFYHSGFSWGDEVVSVRLGTRHATGPQYPRLRGRHVQRLHIEDPFLVERNLHCVLGGEEEAELWQAFGQAAHQFSTGALPAGLEAAAAGGEPAAEGSALEQSGGSMLMMMLQQGKRSIEDGPRPEPEPTLSDATASTAAGHSSGSSDGGSGDEALVGTLLAVGKSRCSSSLESVASTRASTVQHEAQESHSDADAEGGGAPPAGPPDRPSPPADRWADVPVDQADSLWSEPSFQTNWWQMMPSNKEVPERTGGAQLPKAQVRTLQDLEAEMGARRPALTVADLEEGMAGAAGPPGAFDVRELLARPRAARSTHAIAARVSKACLRQAA